ncbi:tyrosine-type recombinase/integrase [Paractinoplanes atraurantiacus]|uniref:Phage integrase family protein n=1 Tax=Paractinoplanes atraurantiacus TaxID=1036182 RepID=A0A285JD78_9ACTN|nr:tyrosine-type recombinase/integrase [Actinoplanes atraurantiacus]SNY58224.1 Phage integrase family protein [Actinoplanes atraurantiacus]
MSTYDVKVWSIQEHRGKDRKTGKPKTTYRVRWVVAGKVFSDRFETKALAESHRSKLITAQREGIAFDEETGLPEPMARALKTRSWYDHAVAFVDMKWPRAAGKHRMSIAEALSNVTLALLKNTRGAPPDDRIRKALYTWSFNKARRDAGPPPDALASTIRWVAANTVTLNDLEDAALIRKALDLLSLRLDGKQAAATTIARKRAVFYGALRYAVELRLVPAHPMDHVQWVTPKSVEEVDRRSVINPQQALDLLAVVADKHQRLVAFFACLYYAAMRPAEALHLRIEDCDLPEEGWGMLRLAGSTQHVGQGWGDDSEAVREDRELKHRAKTAVRPVPAAPPLVRALRWHIAAYGHAPDGRLFVTQGHGHGSVSKETYSRVWRHARRDGLSAAQSKSPLAKRPYDLRHAAVSLWLNEGVPATQVAEWAGHSVNVLLKVYAKCIDGQDEAARRRIEVALGETGIT